MTISAPPGAVPQFSPTPREAPVRAWSGWALLVGAAALLIAVGYALTTANQVIDSQPALLGGGAPNGWVGHAAVVVQFSAPGPILVLLAAILLTSSQRLSARRPAPAQKPNRSADSAAPTRNTAARLTLHAAAGITALLALGYAIVGALGLTLDQFVTGDLTPPPPMLHSGSLTVLAIGVAALAVLTATFPTSRTTTQSRPGNARPTGNCPG
jgi:hypothetical protein